MLTEVKINDTDVSGNLIEWENTDTWGEGIDELEVIFNPNVNNTISVITGQKIDVKRGFDSATEEYVFEGIITSVRPEGSKIECTCKGLLIESIKAQRTVSFDKDIDPEAGVGSEIIKNYITHSGLTYDSDSIVSTGTEETAKLIKVVQNEEDDYTIMQKITDDYNYSLRREPGGHVEFKPKGFSTYPNTLEVGVNIVGKLEWEQDIEELCNKVVVNGATVFDKVTETFAGPATTFTLNNTPDDTEVRQTNDAGALFTRGQKDVGVIGTDFDYYVDAEEKKIVFSGNESNIWIRYGSQVPMPVVLKSQASIDEWGGPNKTPNVKKFTYNDIKDVADAERRGRAYIVKFGQPFNSTEIKITDSQLKIQVPKPGDIVPVIDISNKKDLSVFIREVTKKFPHRGDVITVGDKIWRLEDWQADQQKQIDSLFNELNKNQDILISIIDLDRTNTFERRDMAKLNVTVSGGFVLGNPLFDVLGSGSDGKLGRVASGESMSYLRQGGNVYKEFFYDDKYDGTGNATWDTSDNELAFTSGQTRTTDLISLGVAHSFFTVELGSLTGSVLVEITGDDESNYQTVTLGVRTAFSVATVDGVRLRITENDTSTATIETTFDTVGKYDEPGIKVTLED